MKIGDLVIMKFRLNEDSHNYWGIGVLVSDMPTLCSWEVHWLMKGDSSSHAYHHLEVISENR